MNNDFGLGTDGHLDTDHYAIILPTLHEESCVVPTSSYFDMTLEVISDSVLDEGNIDATFSASLYGVSEVPPSATYSPDLDDDEDFTLYDIQFNEVYRNDVCTEYDTTVTAFNPPLWLDTGTYCEF